MSIINQKEFFDNSYKDWLIETSHEKVSIAKKAVELLEVSRDSSLLDIGAGTGILYCVLKDKQLKNYVALDISKKMLEELNRMFPKAETICLDFDKKIELDKKFDYIIIFNSIPHFKNLDIVFENAKRLLKDGGKFSIAHARTREGLKNHHKKIGYNHGSEPIPSDNTLNQMSLKHGFMDVILKDHEFFYFSCIKNDAFEELKERV